VSSLHFAAELLRLCGILIDVAVSSLESLIFVTDNLVEDLLSYFEYELQPPYLLYRNAAQEVNGIWFYNQHDCEAVASLFGR
jgi:hypothetical protein